MVGSPPHTRAGNSWRAAAWALVCTGMAGGALVLSLSTAAAVPLPPPLGPCSGPACPDPFPPVNNGDFTGRDDTINLLVGGNMTVGGRAAEAEGEVVVLGNLLIDKSGTTGNIYNMGVAGVGSRVPPTTGTDYVTVGGNVTANPSNAILVGGSDSTGTIASGNVRYAGTATGTITIDSPGLLIKDAGAAAPFLDLPGLLTTLTACYATQLATGTVVNEFGTATFTGDGKSMLQVFNVTEPLDSRTGGPIGLDFTGIPAGATVLVNMLDGSNGVINTYTGGGAGDTTNALGPKLLWNFPTVTNPTITGSAQFMGSVMVGNTASTTTISEPGMNGRVYLAGNLLHTGSGGYEIHAYPFNGDMPDCAATPTPTPTTTTATPTPTPTPTTPTPTPTTPTPTPTTPTPTPTTPTPTPTPTPTTPTPTPTTPIPTPTTPTPIPTATTATPTVTPATTAPGPSPSPTASNSGGHLPKTGASGVLTWFFVLLGTLAAGLALNRAAHFRRGNHR